MRRHLQNAAGQEVVSNSVVYSGTSNRITISGTVIDISASYVGQTSITTLGTIALGVWHGTKIGLPYGGTNADLSATGPGFLKQATTGADVTVDLLVAGDIPDIAESQVTNLVSHLALKAPLASPTLTGTPVAPTASAFTNTTQIATTAYTDAAVAVENGRATTAEGLLAPLASPALTGNPTAPTQSPGNNSTRLATTAYVDAATGAITVPVVSVFGRTGAVVKNTGDYAVADITGAAPLDSPTFINVPTAPTASALTNNTQIATTAYVDTAIAVIPVTPWLNSVLSYFGG